MMHRIGLATPRHVITLCDHVACPTIKSNNESHTVIVVKSDENSHSIETGRNYGDDNHYELPEDSAVGGAHQ
jgi:hypothetical protein